MHFWLGSVWLWYIMKSSVSVTWHYCIYITPWAINCFVDSMQLDKFQASPLSFPNIVANSRFCKCTLSSSHPLHAKDPRRLTWKTYSSYHQQVVVRPPGRSYYTMGHSLFCGFHPQTFLAKQIFNFPIGKYLLTPEPLISTKENSNLCRT